MRKSKKGVGVLFLFLCILPLFTDDTAVKISTRVTDFEKIVVRSILDCFHLRLFILAEEDESIQAGISSYLYTAGPVHRYGLLREIFNPLGYSVCSTVFSEKTDMRLNTSFSPGSSIGVRLNLFCDSLWLFLLAGRSDPLKIGWAGRISFSKELLSEVLFMTSRPEREEDSDDWFFKGAPYPGGRVFHFLTKGRYRKKPFESSLSLAASLGAFVSPGFFLHYTGTFASELLFFSVLFGIKNRDYVNPDGDSSNAHMSLDTKGKISLQGFPEILVRYKRLFEHGVPGESGFCLSGTEQMEAGTALDLFHKDSVCFRFSMVFSRENEYGGKGVSAQTDTLEVFWVLENEKLLKVNAELEFADVFREQVTVSASFKAVWRLGMFRIEGSIGLDDIVCRCELTSGIRADIHLDHWSLFGKLNIKEPVILNREYAETESSDSSPLFSFTFGGEVCF